MQASKVAVAGLVLSGLVFGFWWAQRGSAEHHSDRRHIPSASAQIGESAIAVDRGVSSRDAPLATAERNESSYRETIRRRVEHANKPFKIPAPPAMRSPTGEKDTLQCAPPDSHCDAFGPLSASSWDEAQWMRRHGFLDAAQALAAADWSETELDHRAQLGEPAAVAELAKRYLAKGEELEAKEVLMDGVRRGNIYAAHQLAAIDEGRTLPFYKRPGLEWLFVARRMGDAQVGMTYITSRYPNLQPSEIDHAMLVADRRVEQFRLHARPMERRPDR